jgi:hypothetical protein
MTNIQKIESAINESRRGRFLMYDNPESANKKIVIDTANHKKYYHAHSTKLP